MIGGIDLVGTVTDSKSEAFRVGDAVLVNGFGVGTDHFGGFCEEASVRSEWAMALSDAATRLTALDAARIGTAGYTAMLCVNAIQNNGVKKEDGPILVTGELVLIGKYGNL
jgi:acrylyl-CoA reductase (NADPH)